MKDIGLDLENCLETKAKTLTAWSCYKTEALIARSNCQGLFVKS